MSGRVPDVLLERYLAGDLSLDARARVEAELTASAPARARLAELRQERDAFLAADPPERFAHRVHVQVATRRRSAGRRLLLWLAPAGAAAAALLVFAVSTRQPAEQRSDERPAVVPAHPPMAYTAPAGDGGARAEPSAEKASSDRPRPLPAPAGGAAAKRAVERPSAPPASRAAPPAPARVEARGALGGAAPVEVGLEQPAADAYATPAAGASLDAAGPVAPSAPAGSPHPASRAKAAVESAEAQAEAPAVDHLELSGSLGRSQVQPVLGARRAAVLRSAGLPPGSAPLVLVWEIDAAGAPASIDVEAPALAAEARARVLAVVSSWRFPRTAGSTQVRWTVGP